MSLSAPPLRGSKRAYIGARRGVKLDASLCVEPPSLSLPRKGGGESKMLSPSKG